MPVRYPECRSRRGVTLLELMVALAVTGLSLLAARLLIEEIDDAGISLSRYTRMSDKSANGERVLRSLPGRAEVSADSVRRFRGDPQSMSFDSWCERPAGWMERCRVGLAIGVGRDSSAISALLSTGEVLHLRSIAGIARFHYVTRDTSGTRWLGSWGQSITAPYAVIIENQRDTVILIVGERG